MLTHGRQARGSRGVGAAFQQHFLSQDGSTLVTCAIRPAAIYGEGEERHFPRIVSHFDMGLFLFTIGRPSDRVDWVHVDNLTQACDRALHALAACQGPTKAPAGTARFPSGTRKLCFFVFRTLYRTRSMARHFVTVSAVEVVARQVSIGPR